MEQVQTAPRSTATRDFLINAIDVIENLPCLRPRWLAFDVAVIVLLFMH